MKHCAFLTMNNLEAFVCYDHLLIEPLAELGWQVKEVPWQRSNVNWNIFDAVIIRSPWDYQDYPIKFMKVLEHIDASSAHLENSLNIIQWNINKNYLKDMQAKGIPIVPTQWLNRLNPGTLPPLFNLFETNDLIIKPLVSANADHTYRIDRNIDEETLKMLKQVFYDRPLMVQPFVRNIIDEGEFSLFYFAGEYSHAILKTPAADDFRVQEEHGGKLKKINPEPALLNIGHQTMQCLPEMPLYARVDLIRTVENKFALMELELIEPSLYFNMDPTSPRRFSRQFDDWMNNRI